VAGVVSKYTIVPYQKDISLINVWVFLLINILNQKVLVALSEGNYYF
jgi:hypothetical protein